MFNHLLHIAMSTGSIVHAGRHLWVTTFDGEGWKSAFDALAHLLRNR